jgi:hypothetical protein
MATSFKQKVGEGFLGMVWKGLFTAMMFLAALGAMKYGIGGQQ